MSKVSYSEIYENAVEKANAMCCPECESVGSLKYADNEVLVCENCQFSIEAEDLQPEWQEKLENEMGFYDDYEDESNYDEEDEVERLSVYEAAEIWAAHGKDEDYTFGYSEEELEEVL